MKRNYNHLKEKALDEGADIAIFGHTHIPYLKEEKEITLFNPGAVLRGNYGVISFEENKVEFIHKEI